MHFQLFLPEKFGANPQHLADVGLGPLLRTDDQAPAFADVTQGTPDGRPGQFVHWLTDGVQDLGYRPDEQTWLRSMGPANEKPKYFVGWNKAQPPRPEDLARKVLIGGHRIELGDGQFWQVPSALRLPETMKLTDKGWLPVPKPQYEAFVKRSQWAFDACRTALNGLPNSLLAEATEFALEALGWNYRLVPELVSERGLLDPLRLYYILAGTTDLQRLQDIAEQVRAGEPQATPSG